MSFCYGPFYLPAPHIPEWVMEVSTLGAASRKATIVDILSRFRGFLRPARDEARYRAITTMGTSMDASQIDGSRRRRQTVIAESSQSRAEVSALLSGRLVGRLGAKSRVIIGGAIRIITAQHPLSTAAETPAFCY